MDRFQELLWDLGTLIDLPLHIDKNRACKLVIEGKLAVQIEMDAYQEKLLISTIIVEIPPGKFREILLKETLKVNGTHHPIGTFAYIEKINALCMFKYLEEKTLNGESLADFLAIFIEIAFSWKNAVESGHPAPPEYLNSNEEKSKPGLKI